MSDYLFYCAKCNSLIADKYENDDVTCDDCWGRMTPLHITEDDWSSMSDADKTALLDKYRNPQPQVQKKRPSSTNQHSNSKQRAKKISNSDQSYNTQEKDYYDRISGLSITSFVFSFFIGLVGIILGIIDLTKNDGRKKGLSIAAVSIGAISLVGAIILSFVYLPIGGKAKASDEVIYQEAESIVSVADQMGVTISLAAAFRSEDTGKPTIMYVVQYPDGASSFRSMDTAQRTEFDDTIKSLMSNISNGLEQRLGESVVMGINVMSSMNNSILGYTEGPEIVAEYYDYGDEEVNEQVEQSAVDAKDSDYEHLVNLVEEKKYDEAVSFFRSSSLNETSDGYSDSKKYFFYAEGMQFYEETYYGDAYKILSKHCKGLLDADKTTEEIVSKVGNLNGVYLNKSNEYSTLYIIINNGSVAKQFDKVEGASYSDSLFDCTDGSGIYSIGTYYVKDGETYTITNISDNKISVKAVAGGYDTFAGEYEKTNKALPSVD